MRRRKLAIHSVEPTRALHHANDSSVTVRTPRALKRSVLVVELWHGTTMIPTPTPFMDRGYHPLSAIRTSIEGNKLDLTLNPGDPIVSRVRTLGFPSIQTRWWSRRRRRGNPSISTCKVIIY